MSVNVPLAIEEMRSAVNLIDAAYAADDVAAQMSSIARLCRVVPSLAVEIVERGAREGMTQRRMAELLEIPESSLRGARKEFVA